MRKRNTCVGRKEGVANASRRGASLAPTVRARGTTSLCSSIRMAAVSSYLPFHRTGRPPAWTWRRPSSTCHAFLRCLNRRRPSALGCPPSLRMGLLSPTRRSDVRPDENRVRSEGRFQSNPNPNPNRRQWTLRTSTRNDGDDALGRDGPCVLSYASHAGS